VGVYSVVIVILNDGNVDVNDDVNVVMVEFVISWDVELWIGDANRAIFVNVAWLGVYCIVI